jgi:hypothetical protein
MDRPCPAGVAGRIALTYGKEGRLMEKFLVLQSSPSTPDAPEEALTRFEVWCRKRKTDSRISRFVSHGAFNECTGIPANLAPAKIAQYDKLYVTKSDISS